MMAMIKVMFLQMLRDRGGFAMAFLLPPLIFMIFASIFSNTNDGNFQVKVALSDEVRSVDSERLVEALKGIANLTIVNPASKDQVYEMIKKGYVDAALIIRNDLASALPPVLIWTDASKAMLSPVLSGFVSRSMAENLPDIMLKRQAFSLEKVIGPYSEGQIARLQKAETVILEENTDRTKASKVAGLTEEEPLKRNSQANATVVYYVGAVTILFLLFSAFHFAATLIDERQSGIFQRLKMGPSGLSPLVMGKYIFLIVLGMVQACLIAGIAILFYHLNIWPHFGLWLVTTFLASSCAAGLALGICSFCSTRHQAQTLSTFLVLVVSAIGGSMVPRFMMPPLFSDLGWLTPNAWAIEAYESVLWRDEVWQQMLWPWTILALFAMSGLVASFWSLARLR